MVPWCVPPWGWDEFLVTIKCIVSGAVIRGACPAKVAEHVRNFLDIEYAIPLNRGRSAIEVALRAMGIGAGDDVVLPSYICVSVMEAVRRTGARAVFADIGLDLNVNARTVQDAITSRTKCVIVAHLFGRAARIDEIERQLAGTGIQLIDDAAQSFGARCAGRLVGSFGDCGIVSCGPGKSLAGAAGGMFVTNNRDLYERVTAMRLGKESTMDVLHRNVSFWIWRRFRRWTLPFRILLDRVFGPEEEPPHTTCAMSNLDGAIMLQQMRAYARNSERRRLNSEALADALGKLAEFGILAPSPEVVFVKHVLVLSVGFMTVAEAIALLAQDGIEAQGGYHPLHLKIDGPHPNLAVTEDLWNRVLCIPIDLPVRRRGQHLKIRDEYSRWQHGLTGTLRATG